MTNTDQFPDRPLRGRRLSWEEFYELRPDLRPANDNSSDRSRLQPNQSTLRCSGDRFGSNHIRGSLRTIELDN